MVRDQDAIGVPLEIIQFQGFRGGQSVLKMNNHQILGTPPSYKSQNLVQTQESVILNSMKYMLVLFLITGFFPLQSLAAEKIIIISAGGGSDANDGSSLKNSIRTLDRAQRILFEARQKGEQLEDIRIAFTGGDYYCREMESAWSFFNPPFRITFDGAFSGPRARFHGKSADGVKCKRGVWLYVKHGKIDTGLTISGFSVDYYKGGITIVGPDDQTKVKANVTISDNVFSNLGDLHYTSTSAGKGAIIMTRSNGNKITKNLFQNIENGTDRSGLIHAIYQTSLSGGHMIEGNTFEQISGSAIKVTDFSNSNTIRSNHFSYTPAAFDDRWCGALENPSECPGAVPQCPSWNNLLELEDPLSRNVVGPGVKRVFRVVEIPPGQECRFDAPAKPRFMTSASGN